MSALKKGGNGLYWLLSAAALGLLGWLWWHHHSTADPKSAATAKSTNAALRPLASSQISRQAGETLPATTRSNGFNLLLTLFERTATNPAAKSSSPTPQPATNSAPPVIPTFDVVPNPLVTSNLLSDSSSDSRSPKTILELQVALARHGISSGSIDGRLGAQTRAALRAVQEREHLPMTGEPDTATRAALLPIDAPYTTYVVTAGDLESLAPIGSTWLAKSLQDRLNFETALELVAEKAHSHPKFIRALNPGIDWSRVAPGTTVTVPNVEYPPPRAKAAWVRIRLGEKILQAFDASTNLIAHFPCSIAQRVEKRPVGMLFVEKAAENPNYRFDPEIFPESEEGRRLGRKLMIPPGPNNPVGTAWISLSRPGYGIHGTPRPEEVGRTESHGCFRLANWNAEYLLQLVSVGTPVLVEP